MIGHAIEYVRENVHTNGMESFWSLLKRGLNGTYYQRRAVFTCFATLMSKRSASTNRQDMTDSDRFDLAVRQIVGKRLPWDEVAGKVTPTQAN